MSSPELVASTKVHEGKRLTAYLDTKNIWTIGYGTNLQDLTITDELAEALLKLKLDEAEKVTSIFSWLSAPRRDALTEMVYNLGPTRFAGFKKLHAALSAMNWENAAYEMLDSDWRKQVGKRAERLAQQMRSGEYWSVT
jgi:lysozyme